MANLKLFVWKDGLEEYDFEAYACVLASSIEEAWHVLEEIYDISIDTLNKIKKIPPEIHSKPNGFILKGDKKESFLFYGCREWREKFV